MKKLILSVALAASLGTGGALLLGSTASSWTHCGTPQAEKDCPPDTTTTTTAPPPTTTTTAPPPVVPPKVTPPPPTPVPVAPRTAG